MGFNSGFKGLIPERTPVSVDQEPRPSTSLPLIRLLLLLLLLFILLILLVLRFGPLSGHNFNYLLKYLPYPKLTNTNTSGIFFCDK